MTLLENEQFLSELTRMFQKSRTHGSVSITMKRYDGRTKPIPRDAAQQHQQQSQHHEYKCLFRAKMGNKKISTVVSAKDVNKFQLAYASLCKACMDNLKKRDRKAEKERKEKRKETAGASTAASKPTPTTSKPAENKQ